MAAEHRQAAIAPHFRNTPPPYHSHLPASRGRPPAPRTAQHSCVGRGGVCWWRNIGKPQPHPISAILRPLTTATFRQAGGGVSERRAKPRRSEARKGAKPSGASRKPKNFYLSTACAARTICSPRAERSYFGVLPGGSVPRFLPTLSRKSRHGVQGRAAPCPAPRSATARNPTAALASAVTAQPRHEAAEKE